MQARWVFFFMAKRVFGGSLYYSFRLCCIYIYRIIPALHSHCYPTDMCEHVANHLKFHSIKIGLQTLIPTAKLLAQFSYK